MVFYHFPIFEYFYYSYQKEFYFMKKQINKKTLRLRTFLVFTLILLAALGCMHLLHSYQEKEEKLKASYTA